MTMQLSAKEFKDLVGRYSQYVGLFQYSIVDSLPTASSDFVWRILGVRQVAGTSPAYLYICLPDGESTTGYSWVEFARGTGPASGTSSITSGNTSVAVSHGLGYTPTIDQIMITFAEQGTNDYGRWWVDTIGSSTFTVNVSADPGASNLDFGWRVL